MKTHSNVKSLQRAYESLRAELNKLTSVSNKKIGSNVKEEATAVKDPMSPAHLGAKTCVRL
jgi:hypothetical protein